MRGKHCDGIAGIIEEGKSVMEEDFDEATMDACLIAAGQRAEHYEMAAYGTLVAWARAMGHAEAADLLQQTLDEEKAADEKLSELAAGIHEGAAPAPPPPRPQAARGPPPPPAAAGQPRGGGRPPPGAGGGCGGGGAGGRGASGGWRVPVRTAPVAVALVRFPGRGPPQSPSPLLDDAIVSKDLTASDRVLEPRRPSGCSATRAEEAIGRRSG